MGVAEVSATVAAGIGLYCAYPMTPASSLLSFMAKHADEQGFVFYTNLENKNRTLTIDLRSRQVTRTWLPGCGAPMLQPARSGLRHASAKAAEAGCHTGSS